VSMSRPGPLRNGDIGGAAWTRKQRVARGVSMAGPGKWAPPLPRCIVTIGTSFDRSRTWHCCRCVSAGRGLIRSESAWDCMG